MIRPEDLLQKNQDWSLQVCREDPEFFRRLSLQQSPEFLWIGCSDSRVPANQVTGLAPGEVFVHRNVANVVSHGDLNCLSVMQFAVDILKVRHIIVCGHYGCGGVLAVLEGTRVGLADNWLRHVGDVAIQHQQVLADCDDPAIRHDKLCQLNVIEQVINVCQTTVVQDAWARGQALSVHGWIYGLVDGRIHELSVGVEHADELYPAYGDALAKIRDGRGQLG